MAYRRKKKKKKKRPPPQWNVGAVPGTWSAPESALPSTVSVIAYDENRLEELGELNPDEMSRLREKHDVIWVNVNGLGNQEVLEAVADEFDLHDLELEDVVFTTQRAKSEPWPDHTFTIVRMVFAEEETFHTEQLSLFVGDGWVVTIQETPQDPFNPVRVRLRKALGRIRRKGSDYLGYALLDALVDAYFPVMDTLGDRLAAVEHEILTREDATVIEQLHEFKTGMRPLQRSLRELREVVAVLQLEPRFADIEPFMRDLYDHVVRAGDRVDSYVDFARELLDVFMSLASHKLNEVMRLLTIISTIFIPLGFLAGLYGMNFDTSSPFNMPELSYRYAYPILLAVMFSLAVGMLLLFAWRGWLGGPRRRLFREREGGSLHD